MIGRVGESHGARSLALAHDVERLICQLTWLRGGGGGQQLPQEVLESQLTQQYGSCWIVDWLCYI